MSKPTVVIIAGGANSRFFPFNTGTHKGALTVCGKKLISRTLQNLDEHGFDDIVLVVGERDFDSKGLSADLEADAFPGQLRFVLQEQARGMGDAVLTASKHIEGQFAVVFPNFFTAGEVLDDMLKSGRNSAVCVTETDQPWLFGIVTVDDDRATSIIEKPVKGTEPSNLKVEGAYLLSPTFLEILRGLPEAEFNFETALNELMHSETVGFIRINQDLPTLKFPWHLFDIQTFLFDQLTSHRASTAEIAPTAIIDESLGPVYIDSGATINHAARIVGPAYIGKNVLVGDYSLVRQSSLEADVQVGSYTEVARSIIMPESTIHYGYLADSIIGRNVKIGAGLITANKRFDRQGVRVLIKEERVDSGRENLGVLVGDNANIGIRTSTMPGVAIGADAIIFPGQIIQRNVEHKESVYGNFNA